jgi:hypothetical protein
VIENAAKRRKELYLKGKKSKKADVPTAYYLVRGGNKLSGLLEACKKSVDTVEPSFGVEATVGLLTTESLACMKML